MKNEKQLFKIIFIFNTAKQTGEIKGEKCAAEECCWGKQPAEILLLKKGDL